MTDKLRMSLLAAALVVAGTSAAFSKLNDEEGKRPAPPRVEVSNEPLVREGKLAAASFSSVVKKTAPSVVNIFTTTTPKGAHPNAEMYGDPLFRRFFGEPEPGRESRRAPKQHGLGSGVIVSEDGYILTNHHVVQNADEIRVALQDGREFNAKVVGSDPKSEIAVLKIDATGLKTLALANSDLIEVGDVVLAIGNPFGIGQTVTMGIVSGTGRGNMGLDYEDFIQTDAAINPGNSGGALIDAQGRLVGINTMILSRTGANHGIGFAVPSNLAKFVMDNLVEHGSVQRGFLGVNIQDITPGLAEEFGLKERTGALVAEVSPRSPAEKAGLKSGDVIVEFNGKPVRDSRNLKLQVSQAAPGAEADVTVLRDGKNRTMTVVLQKIPGGEHAGKTDTTEPTARLSALEGVSLEDLSNAVRRQLRIPAGVEGALVAAVNPESPAYEAGLREGDVIVEINRQRIKSAADAEEISGSPKDRTTLLRVWSRGGSRFVVVESGKLS